MLRVRDGWGGCRKDGVYGERGSVSVVVPLFALEMRGEIVRDGGFVRKILFGFAVTVLVSGGGLGQVTAPATAPPPSTVSAVSRGGAGKTMLLWPAGGPGALGGECVCKSSFSGFFSCAPHSASTDS